MNANSEPAPSSMPTMLSLSPHVSALSIAEESHNALRVFLEQSEGWSKAELVLWCGGLYAPIARHGAALADRRGDDSDSDYRHVNPLFVERMIEIARKQAFDVLASFALPRARLEFMRDMNEEGAVTRCQDRSGAVGFVPTPVTDSLADRVVALIAADVFARPGDFDGIVYDGRHSGFVTKQVETISVPKAG